MSKTAYYHGNRSRCTKKLENSESECITCPNDDINRLE